MSSSLARTATTSSTRATRTCTTASTCAASSTTASDREGKRFLMATSIASAIRWWGRTKPDAPALVIGDDTVSYGTIHHWSSRVARSLAERGVEPGDFVCVLGGNTVEWAAAAHGVLKVGAVLQPVSPRAVGAELAQLASDVGAAFVIVDPAFQPVVDDAVSKGAALEAIPMSAIGELRTGADDEFVVDIDPDDVAMVLWTSGSTGRS